MEVDLLRENRGSLLPLTAVSSPGVDLSCRSGGKLHKTHFNIEEILSDPYKTRLYVEKLKSQLREKVGVGQLLASSCFVRVRLE